MRKCNLAFLPTLLVAIGMAGEARAADVDSTSPTVDLQLFHPSPGANNFFTTESGDINSHLGISAGLSINYARNPLAVQILEEDGGEKPIGAIVGYRVDANLMAAIGLFGYGDIGLVMPLTLQGGQDDNKFNSAGVDVGKSLKGFTQGDLRIVPKVRFLNLDGGLLSAAVVATVVVPSAGKTPYASENSVVVAPSVALSTRMTFLRAAINLGYRLRDRTRVEPIPNQVLLTVDDEVFFKAAVAFDLNMGEDSPLEIIGEIFGHTPAANAFAWNADSEIARRKQWARTSLEADIGVRWFLLEDIILTGGVGAGIMPQGYGQPAPRLFVGCVWYNGDSGAADGDMDGVPDSLDQCPEKKEDKDDFKDDDGCPEIDNDEDNVVDEDDQCPNDPEDKDGLADEDGCPETDVDEDGVLDENDQCQGDVEDKDGFEDENGCADLDNDEDGIADKVDKCPDEAEDVDNFEDIDGCPDIDNDGDGLPDLGDLCPNHAEDKDGVADDDGCPEDNDGDGIPDDLDKCPNKAEVYNGVDDEDGCPEKLRVKSLVTVTEEKIEIKEKIYFRTGSAKVMKKSFKLLDQVASVLKNYKHLKRVRIEGHTDSRGSAKRNLKLSQDRADSVRQYLIEQGVHPDRLVAEGFGPEKPISSNRSRRGREQNRRVEFVIAEQTPIGTDVSEGQPGPEPAVEMEGTLGEEGVEMEMDFGTEPTPPPAPEPPAPAPEAGSPDSLFEPEAEAKPEAEPEPEPEPEKPKGKGKKKRKGKGKGKKKEPKEEDVEIEFEF
ncbi:OmpA family protein [Myxococcota bacterium]